MLTNKYGPLPGWGWVAVIVVGVVLWRKLHPRASATSSQTTSRSNMFTGGQASNIPTETITLPSGASYSGPAGSAPSGFATMPGKVGATTPGGTTTTHGTGSYAGLTKTQWSALSASWGGASAAPKAPADPYAGEIMTGSGYGTPTHHGPNLGAATGGGLYAPINNPATAGSLSQSGHPLFFQPSRGYFSPDTPQSHLQKGTPLYQKVG